MRVSLSGMVCSCRGVRVKAAGAVGGGGLDLQDASQQVLGDSGEQGGRGTSSGPREAAGD